MDSDDSHGLEPSLTAERTIAWLQNITDTFKSMIEAPPDQPRPQLAPDTLDVARALRPGADVYALIAEWEAMWRRSGSPRLRVPDKAFLGWLEKHAK